MPLLLDTARSSAAADWRGSNCLIIALVNNMPDAACEATERQFLDLLRAAAANVIVRFVLFSIPEIRHADAMREGLAGRYRDIDQLWDLPVDGLIVTGTEPRAARLQDEPYWPALAKLVDWSHDNGVSAIWSCLAAHAAVLHADGIEREALGDKLFGVFDCRIVADHRLLAGAPSPMRVPHSRYNGLAEKALVAGGYRILTRSAEAGVDAFIKDGADRSLSLFFQGHPEYDADSLLREYRRDVGRFLRGERDRYPSAPQGLLGDEATAVAEAFRQRAIADRRASLLAEFPMNALAAETKNTWRADAAGIYRNWMDLLKDRKADQLSAARTRPRSRDAQRSPADLPLGN